MACFIAVCNQQKFDLDSYFSERKSAKNSNLLICWRYKPRSKPQEPPRKGDRIWIYRAGIPKEKGIIVRGVLTDKPIPSDQVPLEIRGHKWWKDPKDEVEDESLSVIIEVKEHRFSIEEGMVTFDHLKTETSYIESDFAAQNHMGTIFSAENNLAALLEELWEKESSEPTPSKQKTAVNIRLDDEVVFAIKNAAKERGMPYQTLINSCLRSNFLTSNLPQSYISSSSSLIDRIEKIERLIGVNQIDYQITDC